MGFDYMQCKQYKQYDELFKDIYNMSVVSVEFINKVFFDGKNNVAFHMNKDVDNQIVLCDYECKSIAFPEFLISDARPTIDYYKLKEPLECRYLLDCLMLLSSDKMVQEDKKFKEIKKVIDRLIRIIKIVDETYKKRINREKKDILVPTWIMDLIEQLLNYLKDEDCWKQSIDVIKNLKGILEGADLFSMDIAGMCDAPSKRIILYVNQIDDWSNELNRAYAAIPGSYFSKHLFRTVLHELVHYIHYQYIMHIGNSYWGSNKARAERSTVIECVARWAEYAWLSDEIGEVDAKEIILEELKGMSYPIFPYDAARVYIEHDANPKNLFWLSTVSWMDAYNEILNMDAQSLRFP